jgi:hypothetical protein
MLDMVFSKDIVQIPTLRSPAMSGEEESPSSSSTTKPRGAIHARSLTKSTNANREAMNNVTHF